MRDVLGKGEYYIITMNFFAGWVSGLSCSATASETKLNFIFMVHHSPDTGSWTE